MGWASERQLSLWLERFRWTDTIVRKGSWPTWHPLAALVFINGVSKEKGRRVFNWIGFAVIRTAYSLEGA